MGTMYDLFANINHDDAYCACVGLVNGRFTIGAEQLSTYFKDWPKDQR